MLIELGGRRIEYRFGRRRRRTLGITVDEGGLRVVAPLRASRRDVEAFLRDRQRWILAKLDGWARVPRPPVLHCMTGESLPVFGAPHVLDVRQGRRDVEQQQSTLVVWAPRRSRPADVLLSWLKRKALEFLRPRTAHYTCRLGLPQPRVTLSNARTQWGVCNEDGAIRLSWRLVHLEPVLADYVVAHEVAHLVELNHSKRFWSLVARLYPGWSDARERLELAGASLPILLRGKT